MEWTERLNQSIRYIEDHLTDDDLPCEQLGRIACCSAYHYQRMFSYIAGIPLSEYIRRRKMSLAAVDLLEGERVVDTALKYGYQSPTAFNRAFQSVHGFPPSAVRDPGTTIKSFPPLTIKLVLKGAEEMNYRIETKEAFRIVGLSAPIPQELEQSFAAVPQLWQKAAETELVPRLLNLMDGQPMGILGVCACGDQEDWRYFIAAASGKEAAGLEEYTVPASTWAIFPGSGPIPAAIQSLEQRVVTEWLPASGYEYGSAPDIEVYLNDDPADPQFEVWVPVIKK